MKFPNWDEQDSIVLKVIHQGGQIGSKYLNGDLPSWKLLLIAPPRPLPLFNMITQLSRYPVGPL